LLDQLLLVVVVVIAVVGVAGPGMMIVSGT